MSDTPAHILFVHSSAELYGSDRCLISNVEGLITRGYDVSVVVPYEGPIISELTHAGARVWIHENVVFRKQLLRDFSAKKTFFKGIPPAVGGIKRIIREGRVDLVHTNTGVVLGGALAARSCKVPHVWHFREVFSDFRRAWKLYEPFVAKYSDSIVCISEAVRSQFATGKARTKASVVYDGSLMPVVDEVAVSGSDFTRNVRLKLLCPGRINPEVKGQDVLIDAARQLVDRGIELQVTFLGDVFPGKEDLLQGLRLQTDSLRLADNIVFAGFQENMLPFIDDADLIVVPSRHEEGFGIVILEAFARGKAVIGSRIGGIPEIISDGENGLLVTPGDATALADAIETLYLDPQKRIRMSRFALQDVQDRFSCESTVGQLDDIYTSLLQGRPASRN